MGRSPTSSASTAAGRRRSAGPGTRRSHPPRKPSRPRKPQGRRPAKAPRKQTQRPRRARSGARTPRARRRTPLALIPRRLPSFGPATWRGRIAILVLVLALAAGGYWFWFRDSSFVAVNDVEVVGATSGEGKAIIAELTSAAEEMSDPERRSRAPRGRRDVVRDDQGRRHRPQLSPRAATRARRAAAGDPRQGRGAGGARRRRRNHSHRGSRPRGNGLPVLDLGGSPAAGELAGDPLEKALVAGAAPRAASVR